MGTPNSPDDVCRGLQQLT